MAAEGFAIQAAGAVLMPRLCKPQRLPKVLVPTAIHEAFRRQAQAAGITTAEAVRQLLVQALAQPMGTLAREEEGRRVALAPINAPAARIERNTQRGEGVMTWWTGNVSIVLLAAIPLLIVGYRLWRQRNRRLAAKANVDDYKNAWGHFMHGGRWLHQEHYTTLFDARMLLYPVHQGSSDSAWNWVRACLPAEVTVPMNAPTPAELERVIRSNARARRALLAQRMNDEDERTFFPFQMLASMAMTSAGQGAPDRPWLHGAVGRHWLVEDFNQKTKDIILQDIGLRCHALELALTVEEKMHGEAEAGKGWGPTSKAIWVEHMHGNC